MKRFFVLVGLVGGMAVVPVGSAYGAAHGSGREPGSLCGNAGSVVTEGAAFGSPGVLSGNLLQIPISVPINLCGNTIAIGSGSTGGGGPG